MKNKPIIGSTKSNTVIEKIAESSHPDKSNYKFKCEYPSCLKLFTSKKGSKRHFDSIHVPVNERKYRCMESGCGRAFGIFRHLKSHSNTHKAASEKKFKCDQPGCNKSFFESAKLKSHIANIHKSKDRPYKCEVDGCSSSFFYESRLKMHLQSHSETFYKCNFCDKSYKFQGNLDHHLKKHINPNVYKLFECELCSKKFECVRDLNEHMLHHTGQRLFKCGALSKIFVNVN